MKKAKNNLMTLDESIAISQAQSEFDGHFTQARWDYLDAVAALDEARHEQEAERAYERMLEDRPMTFQDIEEDAWERSGYPRPW